MAREVADDTGTLMAGNLGYSGIYSSSDEDSHKAAMDMFVVCTLLQCATAFVISVSKVNRVRIFGEHTCTCYNLFPKIIMHYVS